MLIDCCDGNEVNVEEVRATMAGLSMYEEEKMIYLDFSEGKMLALDDATAFKSDLIKRWVPILRKRFNRHRISISPLSFLVGMSPELAQIPFEIVQKVFQYCERHAHAAAHEDLTAFDAQFCNLDTLELIKLSRAADILEIEKLSFLTKSAALTRMEALVQSEEILVKFDKAWIQFQDYYRSLYF